MVAPGHLEDCGWCDDPPPPERDYDDQHRCGACQGRAKGATITPAAGVMVAATTRKRGLVRTRPTRSRTTGRCRNAKWAGIDK